MNKDILNILWEVPLLLTSKTVEKNRSKKKKKVYKTLVTVFYTHTHTHTHIYIYMFQRSYQCPMKSNKIPQVSPFYERLGSKSEEQWKW